MSSSLTETSLEELFEFIRNGMNVKQDKEAGGLPITRIETISDGSINFKKTGFAGLLDDESTQKWYLQNGDILFSHINSPIHVGKCAIYDGEEKQLIHGMNLLNFRPDRTKLFPPYAKWLMKSPQFIQKLQPFVNKAVNQASISTTNLKTITVNVHTVPEQKRIAAILDQADALRRQRQRALDHLNQLGQSIFYEMFGDPRVNSLNFPTARFGDIADVRLGKMLDKGKKRGDLTKKYLRNANVRWFSFDLDNVNEMEFYDKELERFKVKKGDLLICEGGEPGRCAIWKDEDTEMYYQKALHRARLDNNTVLPEYINFWFYAAANLSILSDSVTSATIAHLTGQKIKELEIPLPSLEQQQLFVKKLSSYEHTKVGFANMLTSTNTLFASLQQRAFWGEL